MKKYLIFIILLSTFSGCSFFKKTSPDGNISVEFNNTSKNNFSIYYKGQRIVDSVVLGLTVNKDPDFIEKLSFTGVYFSSNSYDYLNMKQGKRINNSQDIEFRDVTIKYKDQQSRDFHVLLRFYNDAVAFRYVFLGEEEREVNEDRTRIYMGNEFKAFGQNYITYYENYHRSDLPADTIYSQHWCFPLLFEKPDSLWCLITEAAVLDKFSGTHLYGKDRGLSIDMIDSTITRSGEWELPWRVFIVGDNLGTIVESNVVEALCPASEITDESWIEPGVAVFPWWSNHAINGNQKVLREYIDGAVDLGWKWIEFDVSLINAEYYPVDDWKTTPWVKDVVDYATSRGINVYGWDGIWNLDTPEKRADIFGRYKDLGIKGIKIDYLNSDSYQMNKHRIDCLRDAARYKLMVSFHGATLPRGHRRTFPNLMTQEAVRGEEYLTLNDTNTYRFAHHNTILPFTRNVVGPMDYTSSALSSKVRKTTFTHEMALPVVFEGGGWNVLCDYPEQYLDNNLIVYYDRIKAVWDDTRFVEGYPGEYVVIARENGGSWYIGGVNGDRGARNIELKFDFLPKGEYFGIKYCDDKADPINLTSKSDITVDSETVMEIEMADRGGFAIIIDPK